MTKFIGIDHIDNLSKSGHDNLYVLIAGGMAAGKSFVVNSTIKTIPIFDIDDIMIKREFLEYTRDQFAMAMDEISKMVDSHMESKLSIVAMGTASNTTVAIDRLHAAKMKGYTTILVHIDAPISQAIEQNVHRLKKGERGVALSEEHKIERTSIGAAQTVAILRESLLVDYFVYYNNARN